MDAGGGKQLDLQVVVPVDDMRELPDHPARAASSRLDLARISAWSRVDSLDDRFVNSRGVGRTGDANR